MSKSVDKAEWVFDASGKNRFADDGASAMLPQSDNMYATNVNAPSTFRVQGAEAVQPSRAHRNMKAAVISLACLFLASVSVLSSRYFPIVGAVYVYVFSRPLLIVAFLLASIGCMWGRSECASHRAGAIAATDYRKAKWAYGLSILALLLSLFPAAVVIASALGIGK